MADPTRLAILDQIETYLEAIQEGDTMSGASNAFRTSVRSVERVLRHWEDVPESSRPWLGFLPEMSRMEPQPGSCFRVVMPVLVYGYVPGASHVEIRDERLNELLDDLIVAMTTDQTLNGNCVMVTAGEHDTDEGDSEGGGVLQMRFEIVYFRTTDQS